MKIVYIVPYFLPCTGGIISHVYNLSKKLICDGHEVEVISSASFPQNFPNILKEKEQIINNVKVIYEKEYFSKIFRHIRKVEIPKDANVIHIHNFDRFLATLAVLKARKYNKPIIITLHGSLLGPKFGSNFSDNLKRIYDNLITKKILNLCNKIIVLCDTEREDIRKRFKLKDDKIVLIPNWIHEYSFEKNIPKQKILNVLKITGGKYIVSLSRIDKNKRLDFIIEAIKDLPSDLHYVIAGPDNGYLYKLLKLSSDKKLKSRIHYIGPVYGEDKFSLLQYAFAFVLPSKFDFFPISVLEAMAQGIPILASNTGCLTEIIKHSFNGFLIETVSDIRKYLLLLYQNAKIRRSIGDNARSSALYFSFNNIYPKILKLYEDFFVGT